MEFMADQPGSGRSFRTFNVLDDFNREGLGIEVGLFLPAVRVVRSLEQIIEWRGKPDMLRFEIGPKYISSALQSEQKHAGWMRSSFSPASRSKIPMLNVITAQ
jgi:putative transposase